MVFYLVHLNIEIYIEAWNWLCIITEPWNDIMSNNIKLGYVQVHLLRVVYELKLITIIYSLINCLIQ